MRTLWIVLSLAAVGCGRIGFDAIDSPPAGGDAGAADAGAADADAPTGSLAPLGPSVAVVERRQIGAPSAVWTGAELGVAWHASSDGTIEFARLSAAGERLGEDAIVTADPGLSTHPSVAWTGDGYGVAWRDERDGNREIYFASLTADGAVVTTDVRVTDTPDESSDPRLVWTGATFVVIWAERPGGVGEEVRAAAIPGDGLPVAGEVLSAAAIRPDAVWTGTEIAAVWQDETADVVAYRPLTAGGEPIADAVLVSPANESIDEPAVAFGGDALSAVYPRGADGAEQLALVEFDREGAAKGPPVRVDDDLLSSGNPAVAVGDGAAVAWQEGDGVTNTLHFAHVVAGAVELRVMLSPMADEAEEPDVVWAGDRFLVVWEAGFGADDSLLFQAFGR